MRNFPLQRNLILATLGLLLVADVTFAYLTTRLSGSREVRQQTLTTESRQVALVRADVERAAKIQKSTPEVLKHLDDFENSFLPATKGYSVVTQQLDEFAKDTRVLMDGVKFRENEVKGRNLTEIGLDVAINGEYNGIVQFLNKLQRSRSVFIVDALGLEQQNSQQGPTGPLKVSLHLRTYFRKA